jgi:AraC family transcriptional regulator of adaptative response/methylated-DNA-[protein]-cysteine methyltransferase
MFKRWAGISPKRFLQFATAGHARELLRDSHTVLDAALDSGLSGPGRLHDLTLHVDALTPGEIRTRGEGTTIRYGTHDTPIGPCLVATTDRGVCALGFDAAIDEVRQRWPRAEFEADQSGTANTAACLFDGGRISLHLSGTNFQIRVWEALLRIPAGRAVSYGDVARSLDQPTASRAVGRAVATNAVAVLIPCHRVLRETGAFGGYRWGTARKRALLAREHFLSR